ncbi:MAG TPA: metallophosphoesterase [Vicinamibacterales bacterium]|nr:metallophosphoesterase [Vicinamibacterales bacterium]
MRPLVAPRPAFSHVVVAVVFAGTAAFAAAVQLPNKEDSLKMAVIGDSGTGNKAQYAVANRMIEARQQFPFELVIMLGDNMYGSERPQDFLNKFERPYKPLLDADVKFYAALGNHDDREQRNYKLFNMNGELYYTFKAPKQNVRFFALESSYMDRKQLDWLERELQGSNDDWKIVFMHHPIYSSGERHGSSVALREVLEPLFLKYNVSVVFAGHEHFYERLKPQKGIAYFTEGGSAKLREGNIRTNSPLTARGFDEDNSFMIVEINGDEMHFQTISRAGVIVDQGVVARRKAPQLTSPESTLRETSRAGVRLKPLPRLSPIPSRLP